jgi:hypothetical protein
MGPAYLTQRAGSAQKSHGAMGTGVFVSDQYGRQVQSLHPAYDQVGRCPTGDMGHKDLHPNCFEMINLFVNLSLLASDSLQKM